MNKFQQTYNAFMESVCTKFNRTDMLPTLEAGFKAFCESIEVNNTVIKENAPKLEGLGLYNTMKLTPDEMLLLQEMRKYYKELCRDGWMSNSLNGGGNPLSAADNLALLDALVEMYSSVDDLPEGFLALYHKLGGKKI